MAVRAVGTKSLIVIFLCQHQTSITTLLHFPTVQKSLEILYQNVSQVRKMKLFGKYRTEGLSNEEKSMICRQFASTAGCVRSFMLAQKCRSRNSKCWLKFNFLLEQQIKFVLNSTYLLMTIYCPSQSLRTHLL